MKISTFVSRSGLSRVLSAAALAIGIATGTAMATWVGRWPDRVLSLAVLLLYSTPGFWIGLMAVLLFSVLFGSALNLVGESASGISRLINELSHVIFRIMGMIVRLAPIGVFAAIASAITATPFSRAFPSSVRITST